MFDIKEITNDINNIYKTAFDEGYKRGFIDGQLKELEKAQQIIKRIFNKSKGD